MTPEEALKNVDSAISQVNANRQTHQVLLQSLQVLAEAIKPKEEIKSVDN